MGEWAISHLGQQGGLRVRVKRRVETAPREGTALVLRGVAQGNTALVLRGVALENTTLVVHGVAPWPKVSTVTSRQARCGGGKSLSGEGS